MSDLCYQSAVELPPLLGNAPCFRAVVDRLPLIARIGRTTLISGPTGSGKDVVARCLHAYSLRRAGPLVTVHCAALPDSLVEAEMFGHSRGAFTGATHSRGGLVHSAMGGTLFLDEIDSLPASAQAKLLRFLETGEYRAVGSDQIRHSDAWVIAATNASLVDRVRAGSFRADLMFRLAVVELQVPSLRERATDILGLARYFLGRIDPTKDFDIGAVHAMQTYPWPGNVRELKHRVESAALLTRANLLTAHALCLSDHATQPGLAALATPGAANFDAVNLRDELQRQLWGLVTGGGMTMAQAIVECEQLLVRAALSAEHDNRSRAADRLGIHVRTIFKKLQRE